MDSENFFYIWNPKTFLIPTASRHMTFEHLYICYLWYKNNAGISLWSLRSGFSTVSCNCNGHKLWSLVSWPAFTCLKQNLFKTFYLRKEKSLGVILKLISRYNVVVLYIDNVLSFVCRFDISQRSRDNSRQTTYK